MADNMIQILEGFSDTGCAGCGSVNGAALWGLGAPAPQPKPNVVPVLFLALFVGAAVMFGRGRRGRRVGRRRGLGGLNPSRAAYGATVPR